MRSRDRPLPRRLKLPAPLFEVTCQGHGGAPMATPVAAEPRRYKFADGIENVTRHVQAAAWPHPSPAFDAGRAVNDGTLLHPNFAQESASKSMRYVLCKNTRALSGSSGTRSR
jgi:hypothetical protein